MTFWRLWNSLWLPLSVIDGLILDRIGIESQDSIIEIDISLDGSIPDILSLSGYPRWLQDWGFGPELLSPEEIVSPAQDFPRSVINLSFWSYFFGLVIMFIRSVIKHLLISVESISAGNWCNNFSHLRVSVGSWILCILSTYIQICVSIFQL